MKIVSITIIMTKLQLIREGFAGKCKMVHPNQIHQVFLPYQTVDKFKEQL